jgi:hypothetical protein
MLCANTPPQGTRGLAVVLAYIEEDAILVVGVCGGSACLRLGRCSDKCSHERGATNE